MACSRSKRRALGIGTAMLAAAMVFGAPASAGRSAALSSFASPLASLAPVVTELKPTAGPDAGGTKVTIKGSNLSGASEVHFGSSGASFTITSATTIKAVSPPGTGIEDVTVTTPEGTSAVSEADRFTYEVVVPAIERLAPTEGRTTGKGKIKIYGTGFTGTTSVHFGSSAALSFTVSKPTLIIAVDPPGTGTVDVTVTNADGTSPITPASVFGYFGKAPEVSKIAPRIGPAAGGASVGIAGLNFLGASAIHFGSIDAPSFTVNTDKSITAISPPETVGTVNVTVTTPYGTSSFEYCAKNRPCAIEDHYKFAEPTITGLTPNSGPAAGGTTVAVSGSGFATTASETTFQFGHTFITPVECASSAACTIVTPAHVVGIDDLQVKVSGTAQTSPTSPADRFTFE